MHSFENIRALCSVLLLVGLLTGCDFNKEQAEKLVKLRPVDNNAPILGDNLDPDFDGKVRAYRYVYHGLNVDQLLQLFDKLKPEVVTARMSAGKPVLSSEDIKQPPVKKTYVANRFIKRTQVALQDSGEPFNVYSSELVDTANGFLPNEKPSSEQELASAAGGPKIKIRPFSLNYSWKFSQGLNFLNSHMLGLISEGAYYTIPEAGRLFHRMGFKEQYYMSALITDRINERDSQGLVLKNDDAIIVGFRGTESNKLFDLLTDMNFFQINLGFSNIRVHAGFYKSMKDLYPFVREHIVSSLENTLRSLLWSKSDGELRGLGFPLHTQILKPDYRPVYFTGHSLGASMATLTYAELLFPGMITREIAEADAKIRIDHDVNPLIAQNSFLAIGDSKWQDYYYFNDPALRALDEAQITSLLSTLVKSAPSAFSAAQKQALEMKGYLYDLPTVESDGLAGSNDDRLRDLTVFGSPRSGNRELKEYVENYAKRAGSTIVRFENIFRAKKLASGDAAFVGDAVTRIPIVYDELAIDYRHIGIRAYFDGEHPRPGDIDALKCEYTDKKNEASLDPHNHAFLMAAAENHRMIHYHQLIQGYLGAEDSAAYVTGDIDLPWDHSCKNFTYSSR